MTIYTPKADGSWETTGQVVWDQAGKPGDGDTISAFDQNITIDANETIGTGSGTVIDAGGGLTAHTLTVSAGKTFTIRGDFVWNNNIVYLALDAGSSLIMKPDSATTAKLDGVGYLNRLSCNGTSGSRVTVTTDKSLGGNNSLLNVASRSGLLVASYADFSHWGTALAIGLNTIAYTNDGYDVAFSVTNCTFDDCNQFINVNSAYSFDFTYTGNIFTNPVLTTMAGLSGFCCGFSFGGAGTAGTWDISNNGWAANVDLETFRARMQFNNNVSDYLWIGAASTWSSNASFSSNVIYNSAGADAQINFYGPVLNLHMLMTAATNPHFATAHSEVDGVVFESTAGAAGGDCLFAHTAAFTVTRCLVNQASTFAAGKLCSMLNAAAPSAATILHNTSVGKPEAGLIHLGENADSYAAEITACRSNLIADITGGAGGAIYAVADTSAVTRAVDSVTISTHNAFLNPDSDTCKYNTTTAQANVVGYSGIVISANTPYPNATIGANDLTLTSDPFVDSTRNWTAWGAFKGLSSPTADEVFTWAVSHAAEATDGTTGSAAWEKAGFKVTGSQGLLLKDAGHDGVTIGAMGFQASGNSSGPASAIGISDLFGTIFGSKDPDYTIAIGRFVK